ncbi:MAG TPA: CDP-glucose 4,6-dehydratase [Pyrinomonadaceae bacterium]|jgi:CDP-glucose 4,6-dehydratase
MRPLFDGVFRGLPVLVTGHTGFKGSWLSIWLHELGAKVIGYSCGSVSAPSNFDLCGLQRRGTHVAGDICDLDKLKWTLETHEPRVVLHLAAQSLVRVSYEEPKRTFDTNVGGTVAVLEAIRRTKSVAAFVGVTTDKVYEDQGWVWGYRENDPLGGHEPYSASKAAAELAIQSYRRSWAGPNFSQRPAAIASARGGNVLGGGDFAPHRLVPDCVCALMAGTPIRLRQPRAIRPWQHVLDLLSGYLWLAANLLRQEGDEFSEAWNFGPAEGQAVSCEAVVREIIALWGQGSYTPAEQAAQGHETPALRLNSVKAAERLAWRPAYDWREAVAATVGWFKEYHDRAGAGGADMYDYCARQLAEYVEKAATLGLRWARP